MDFYGTMVRENDGLIRDIARRVCETSPQVISPGDVAHYWWEITHSRFLAHNGEAFKPMVELEELALLELAGRFESRFHVQDALDEIVLSWQRPEVYSDVRHLLSRMPLQVCIVANGDREHILNAVKFAQLEVQAVVTSEDARSYKPDEGIFRHAVNVMGIKPTEALFVGDSISYDMVPAQKAGLFTAWVNRLGRPIGGRCMPDVTCDNLQQLRRMIR